MQTDDCVPFFLPVQAGYFRQISNACPASPMQLILADAASEKAIFLPDGIMTDARTLKPAR